MGLVVRIDRIGSIVILRSDIMFFLIKKKHEGTESSKKARDTISCKNKWEPTLFVFMARVMMNRSVFNKSESSIVYNEKVIFLTICLEFTFCLKISEEF